MLLADYLCRGRVRWAKDSTPHGEQTIRYLVLRVFDRCITLTLDIRLLEHSVWLPRPHPPLPVIELTRVDTPPER